MPLTTHLSFLEAPLNQALHFYNQYAVPRLTKKNKAIGISAAVALSLYLLVDKLFKPPRKLRHIPYQSYYSFLKGIWYKDTYDIKAQNVFLPIINASKSNGVFMKPDRFGWAIHIANPQDAKFVLMKYDKFPKAEVTSGMKNTLLEKFGGGNMAVINGAHWKSQRMLANPAFKRSMPVKLFGHLTLDLFKAMEESGEILDVPDLMERWTLDAIGSAGFGFNFNAILEKDNEWVKTYNTMNNGLQDPFYFLLPVFDTRLLCLSPKRQLVHKELARFLDMLDQVIIKKREVIANGTNRNVALEENEKDLLTLLIEAEAKGEGVMSNQELKSNLAIFFLAGHDTTSNTLSFALYYLAKHPEIQQKAREEAVSILGDEPVDIIPTVDQTKDMTYINQIIKETLRINCPVLEVVTRVTTEDISLSGTFVPKGSYVAVDIYNMHHAEAVWKDGFKFDPDRFKNIGNISNGLSWVPFGSGPRQCIGMNFSLAEQRVLLSMFLRKFTWTLPEDSIHKEKVVIRGFAVVGPKDLKLQFKKRY